MAKTPMKQEKRSIDSPESTSDILNRQKKLLLHNLSVLLLLQIQELTMESITANSIKIARIYRNTLR